VSYDSNVLALDCKIFLDEKIQSGLHGLKIHSINFAIESGSLLGTKLSEARGESEVLLIDGNLTVSF
jgi:hypothetical protein